MIRNFFAFLLILIRSAGIQEKFKAFCRIVRNCGFCTNLWNFWLKLLFLAEEGKPSSAIMKFMGVKQLSFNLWHRTWSIVTFYLIL